MFARWVAVCFCIHAVRFYSAENFSAGFFCLISVDVIRDKETGRSRGFGFVKYNNAEDAKDAMTAMDGKVVTEQLCT